MVFAVICFVCLRIGKAEVRTEVNDTHFIVKLLHNILRGRVWQRLEK